MGCRTDQHSTQAPNNGNTCCKPALECASCATETDQPPIPHQGASELMPRYAMTVLQLQTPLLVCSHERLKQLEPQ